LRHLLCSCTMRLLICLATYSAFGQTPAAGPAAPSNAKNYLPACSTEKVNGDCFLNIDRRTYNATDHSDENQCTYQLYVFHPFPFETLTLDAGNASAYEGTDQAAALVAAAIPVAKGAVLGQVDLALNADLLTKQSLNS